MKKYCLVALAALCISTFSVPCAVWAEEMPAEQTQQLKAVRSTNEGTHNYINSLRWAAPVKSYLYENTNGALTRVEFINGRVVIEDYGNGFVLQSQRELEQELSLWGGFYAGTDYNFLVFGQNNIEEDDQKEVIRVVKYSKDWERLGAASLCGAKTIRPFEAGSLRMVQDGDKLYIHTCHQMYLDRRDGKNHQANLTFSVNIPNMTVADLNSEIHYENFVGHSFNQFVALDNAKLLIADHGDATPRAVVINKFSSKSFSPRNAKYGESAEVMPIKGEWGDNDTGLMLGGFACSSSSYLTAGCSIPQDSSGQTMYNIFVTSTPKKTFSQNKTSVNWITNYNNAVPSPGITNPHLVNVGGDCFLLIYGTGDKVTYLYLDKDGNPVGDAHTMEGAISDCAPITYQGLVVWYYTRYSVPVFCAIDGFGNPYLFSAQ